MRVADDFSRKFPIATKHIYESQYGIILQLIYSLTGKVINPNIIYSPYQPETKPDLLETVKFNEPFMMVFNKELLETKIINANSELLFIAEQLISNLHDKRYGQPVSSSVRKYMLQTIPRINISLKNVSSYLNMSERTLQRRLSIENTSYQLILDDVRKELMNLFLEKDLSWIEISFLLGFESQSAFNKFFVKHFGRNPSQYKGKFRC